MAVPSVHTWDGASFGAVEREGHPRLLPEGARDGAEALAGALLLDAAADEVDTVHSRRVAVFGLGAVGCALASRLTALEWKVVAHDAGSPSRAKEQLGVQRVPTARAAVEVVCGVRGGGNRQDETRAETDRPPLLLVTVDDEAALRELMSGLLQEPTLLVGATLVVLTQLTPAAASALATACAKHGLRYLHASAGGGAGGASCSRVGAAKAGGLWLWTAGSAEAHAAAAPLLRSLALGITVLGGSPAHACNAALVKSMESLRRSALAVAREAGISAASAAASAAPPPSPLPESEVLLGLRAQLQSAAARHTADRAALTAEKEAAIERVRAEAAAAAARALATHHGLLAALEASQAAGREALQRCSAACEEARSVRRELAACESGRQEAMQACDAATRAMDEAREGWAAALAEASTECARAGEAEAALASVRNEADAALRAERDAFAAAEARWAEERERAAASAQRLKAQLERLGEAAAGGLVCLKGEKEAAEGELVGQRSRAERAEAAQAECDARVAQAEARAEALQRRCAALQEECDGLLMRGARHAAREAAQGTAPKVRLIRPPTFALVNTV